MRCIAMAWMLCALAAGESAALGAASDHIYKGVTDEPCCGGSVGLTVYIRDGQVHKLIWEAESSQRFLRTEYRFKAGRLFRLVERSWRKYDDRGECLARPRQERSRHLTIGESTRSPRVSESIAQANYLIKYFDEHRNEFDKSAK